LIVFLDDYEISTGGALKAEGEEERRVFTQVSALFIAQSFSGRVPTTSIEMEALCICTALHNK
jgi:hypothetical protein